MQTNETVTGPPVATEPEGEKYLVFTPSGDFWLSAVFTDKSKAQQLADRKPGYIVRPLSEVLTEQDQKA